MARDEAAWSRSLRWEMLDPEERALAGSWGIALTAGILWVLLVLFLKPAAPSIQLLRPDEQGVTVNVVPDEAVATTAPAGEETGPVAAPGPTNRPPGRQGPTGNPRQGSPGSRNERNVTQVSGLKPTA